MELSINDKIKLTHLLKQPNLVTANDRQLLSDSIAKYPYYQPLYLLFARTQHNTPELENALAKASLFNGGNLTYQAANSIGIFKTEIAKEISRGEADEQEIFEEIEENTLPQTTDEEEVFDEINELPHNFQHQDNSEDSNIAKITTNNLMDVQEEVYEEIAEVDLNSFDNIGHTDQSEAPTAPNQTENNPLPTQHVPNEMAIGSIVSNDFFAFERKFNPENTSAESSKVTQPEEYDQEAEAQSSLSKYDDDNMPYTFLWWLAKTRKEHAQIFQPYVSKKKPAVTQQGELQHQYVEHIFHLQTPFDVASAATEGPINLTKKNKGAEIIDAFIKNDPQIKIPKAEQINNENKAKKSAEDHYDLVSETLAAIYIEQTLYHKAIDTYEKLSLKFPEKSRYFADLIQSLEKKI